MLDGYDEFRFKKIKINKLVNKKFSAVKIIVTTRPDYATEVEFQGAFN